MKLSYLFSFCLLSVSLNTFPSKADDSKLRDFNPLVLSSDDIELKLIDQNNLKSELSVVNLSLDECILKALEHNPVIKQLLYEIKAQKQLFYAAKTKWLPTLEIEGDPALSQSFETFSQSLIVPTQTEALASSSEVSNSSFNEYDLFSLQQDISIELYFEWNFIDATRNPSIKSEWQLIKQKENLLKLTARKLIAEVSIAYINAQAEQKFIEELNPLIKQSLESEKGLEQELEIGYSDVSKLLQSQTQLLNIINSQTKAKAQLETHASILASLIGVDNSILIYPNSTLQEPQVYNFSLDESVRMSVENNELSKAYMDEAKSFEWASVSDQNQYIPKFYLYLNWYYGSSWGIEDAPVNDPSIVQNSYVGYEQGYIAGIGFNWTFDGGASYFTSRNKKFIAKSLKENASSAELSFVGLTKSNYFQYRTGLQEIDVAKLAVQMSNDNLDALELRSQFGLEDITTLVQAFSLHFDSLKLWIESVRESNIALVNLYRYTSSLPDGVNLDKILFSN